MFHLLLAVIYLSFISLGLPDGLLGSAWPVMHEQLQVPVSYAGIVSMIIAAGTIVSSLLSDRLTRRFGPARITAASVATTTVALFGFSFSSTYWMLCLWAIPYGLGAGGVDAALNNYVALHYSSRHMSWLHCMWGIGASVGPYVMGAMLTGGFGWPMGYQVIGLVQLVLTAVLIVSLPIWQKGADSDTQQQSTALSLREIVAIPGAREIMLTFFCYGVVETTTGLWASSYLFLHIGIPKEIAAGYASMFYIGMTLGRGANGFIANRFQDDHMITVGQIIVAVGIVLLLIPGSSWIAPIGLVVVGIGCAPIYPSIIHSTPAHFGADKSQALIGVQMASAYVGTCLMPTVFGVIADYISVALLPFYLLAALVLMVVMHQRLCRISK